MLAALGAAALISLHPWDNDSVAPDLTLAPDVGAAIGDSVPVGTGHQVAVARAVPAPIGVAVMASKPVPVVKKTVSTPLIGISAARPVGLTGPVSPVPSPPAPAAPETPTEPVLVSAPPATPAPAAEPVAKTRLVANFENGLDGWSTAPAGNIPPRIVRGVVRDGANASAVRLTGEQSRSLLAFGGEGGSDGAVQIREGDEYTFAFSFYIQSMSYGEPGADNAILQFISDASDTRTLGLQLWQDEIADPLNSGRGLWASGDAMGGDRFLAPLAERTWHDVTIRFRASSEGDGFYILSLDGQLLDARGEISLIAPGSSAAQIEVGLLRDSTVVQGTSEIRLDAASLESAGG